MIIDIIIFIVAVVAIYMWYTHQRMIEKHISRIEERIDDLSNSLDCLESRLCKLEGKVYDFSNRVTLIQEDLFNVIEEERRKNTHKHYAKLAERYKQLAKEYAK